MNEQLEAMEQRYEELNRLLADPAVIADAGAYRALLKEHASLAEVVDLWRQYRQAEADLAEAEALAGEGADAETQKWLQAERRELKARLSRLQDRLRAALAPRDPH